MTLAELGLVVLLILCLLVLRTGLED